MEARYLKRKENGVEQRFYPITHMDAIVADDGETLGSFVENTTNEAIQEHVNADNPHGITAQDVGARPNTWTPSASDVGALAKGDVVNNLTSTATDLPLSANQGKTLNDGITAINNNKNTFSTLLSYVPENIVSAIESSFTGATTYNMFQGQTSNGSEFGWIGFKHGTSGPCEALLFSKAFSSWGGVVIIRRDTDNVWYYRKML